MFEDNNYLYWFLDRVCYFLYKIILFLKGEKFLEQKIRDKGVILEDKGLNLIYKDEILIKELGQEDGLNYLKIIILVVKSIYNLRFMGVVLLRILFVNKMNVWSVIRIELKGR